ncbi:Uncharacterised protein [Comamonas testosteroni]|uniref:Uncharacterized protein n=1 Tax=Comamonas testosteroni TaxID=285 RepID=A0A8B4SA95_COMTE|nr:hypothetical protein DFO48_111110 [Comamonas sp. AG1104]SUY79210.1 Uncharacterised protein [Comamonas testosteroni]
MSIFRSCAQVHLSFYSGSHHCKSPEAIRKNDYADKRLDADFWSWRWRNITDGLVVCRAPSHGNSHLELRNAWTLVPSLAQRYLVSQVSQRGSTNGRRKCRWLDAALSDRNCFRAGICARYRAPVDRSACLGSSADFWRGDSAFPVDRLATSARGWIRKCENTSSMAQPRSESGDASGFWSQPIPLRQSLHGTLTTASRR